MAGTSKPITGTSRVVTRLRNNPALLAWLGPTDERTRRLLAPAPMLAAIGRLRAQTAQTADAATLVAVLPLCLTDANPY